MTRKHWWMLGLGGVGAAVAGLAGVGVGVELHRRWPIESAERVLERFSIAVRSIDPWTFRARLPLARYESIAAVVDGKLIVIGGFRSVAIQATPRVGLYDPASNSWSRLADMPVATTHAAAVPRDGELWLAGGFVGDNPGPATDTVWRYDPRADRWQLGPRLPDKRSSGGFVALRDGTLHYFGGWIADRNTASASHWRLPPGDSVWVDATPFPNPRGHLSAVVADGFIYAIGGSYGHDPFPVDVTEVHRYEIATGQWTSVGELPEPRSHAEPGTFVYDGRIYVVGGRSNARGKPSAQEVLAYDPGTDTWSFVMLLPRPLLAAVGVALGDDLFVTGGGERGSNPRNVQSWSTPLGARWRPGRAMPASIGEVAGAVIGNRLFLFGQGDGATLSLNLGTGEWEAADARTRRPIWGNHHAAEALGGEVYLIGGLSRESLAEVQIYDPASDRWRFGPALPYPVGSSASSVIGGSIYVAGGIVGDTSTRQAVVLDPGAQTWRSIAPMPRARNHAASATDGRRLYVFGGRGPGSGDANVVANGYDDVQIYDPATDTWHASGDGPDAPAPLPQARGGMGKAVYVGGEFYVIGGETLDGPGASPRGVYDRVDIYDPVRNTWREGPPLGTARHGIFPVAHGAAVWVVGGGVQAGASTSSVVEVLFPAGPR